VKKTILSLIFFVSCFALTGAQEGPLPPEWFYYQKSLEAFQTDNFGESLKQLKNLVDEYGESPESLHLRARIYEQEGELDLAEKYYLEALEKGGFGIPDEKYAVLYRLADMYYQRKSYKKYEDVLESILSGQNMYTEQRFARVRDAYISTLLSRGFDSLALLYRVPFDFAQEAHRNLGAFYCRTGRERMALLHLAFANLAAAGTLADELKRHDPDYSFTTLEDALAKSSLRPYLTDFLRRSDFYRSLYFMASALYAQGSPREARTIWALVAEYGSGEWKTQSRNQLLAPRAEPLITY
jgi:tetratricopeptide (TPR) repeat protein